MKQGDRVEVLLPRWLAEDRGVGTLFSGVIQVARENAICIKGTTVFRAPPPSDDGALPCRLCQRPLTEAASQSLGYGPDCAVKLGLSNKFIGDLRSSLRRDQVQAAEKATLKTIWLPLTKVTVLEPGQSVVVEEKKRRDLEQKQHIRMVQAEVHQGVDMRHLEISDDPLPVILPMDKVPRPYQWRAARFAVDRRNVYVGDVPGLGKSIEGAVFLMEVERRLMDQGKNGCFLILCPPVMALTWKRTLEEWWQGIRVQVLQGYKAKVNPKAQVYIMPFSIMAQGWEQKKDRAGKPMFKDVQKDDGTWVKKPVPDMSRVKLTETAQQVLAQHPIGTVVDEAHYLKNPLAQRTQAGLQILTPSEYLTLMSGTAVLNRPHELSPQLDALHYLDTIFEGREAYETEYCGRTLTQINTKGGGKRKVFVYNKPKGSKMVELHQRLLPFFIRRKKEDVLTELPPLSFARVVVDLANRKEYEALELEIAMLPPMQRLGKLAQLRQLCGIGKIPSMIEWIEEFLENEEKLVVFATHRSVQRALLEHFVKWKPAAILGQAEGGSIKRNQEQMDRFQTDPDCLLAICSTGAAREGITLHAASNLLMTELEWVPGVMDQAFNRIHRYGQTAERVTIWTLAADQSFDNTLLEKLGAKRLVTGEILDGEAEVLDEQEIKGAVIRDLVARVARRRKAA